MKLSFERRDALRTISGLAACSMLPLRAQTPKPIVSARSMTVVQIADMSSGQIDVSRDFVMGSRVAWQEINAKGGLRGKAIVHKTLETDGSDASLRQAVASLQGLPQVVALVGTVGARAAATVSTLLGHDAADIPHIAPWLQNDASAASNPTFAIFANRQEQIAHAVRSLSVAGAAELGVIYSSANEMQVYRDDVEKAANALNLRLKSYGPPTDLTALGQSLTPQSPRILIFLGGTPELMQFSQGLQKQSTLRYIVAMSDVNLQTLAQAGQSRHAPVIATQVVPLVNSGAQVVRGYRDALTRLFDEPPTPQGLAGYIAARYAFEAMQSVDGAVSRQSLMHWLQSRGSIDLGGFRIDLSGQRSSGSYVTQSMISNEGRIIG